MGWETKREEEAAVDALAHPVRRQLVDVVREKEGAGLGYLAVTLDRSNADGATGSRRSIGVDRMRTELEETHVPRLEAAGLVEFTPETGWVELGGVPEADCESVSEE